MYLNLQKTRTKDNMEGGHTFDFNNVKISNITQSS